jgi:hypothetical protein
VWLSGAVREFLEADRELGAGVERDPGVGEGHEGMLRAGVPIFPQKGRPGLLCEILTPYIGEERARAHVHRLRTDPAYFEEHLKAVREVGERANIISWR